MPKKQLIVVVGADGFVGGGFANALESKRVVSIAGRNGDIHISQAEKLLRKADVIINAGGFRVRRGCTYSDYRRCHAKLVPAAGVKETALCHSYVERTCVR